MYLVINGDNGNEFRGCLAEISNGKHFPIEMANENSFPLFDFIDINVGSERMMENCFLPKLVGKLFVLSKVYIPCPPKQIKLGKLENVFLPPKNLFNVNVHEIDCHSHGHETLILKQV